jgi:hypothetical protein
MKMSASEFVSESVSVKATVADLYDFNYSAPPVKMAIVEYELPKNAAILQIGSTRGLDVFGKIFQTEFVIDTYEQMLIPVDPFLSDPYDSVWDYAIEIGGTYYEELPSEYFINMQY